MNSIDTIVNKNILFLQGPMGGFFKLLDLKFREKGNKTFKIGFNAGDSFFSYRDNYIPYRATKKEWGSFIYDFLKNNKIDKIFLFGDCRFYQRIALQVSIELDIDVFVFEEGYIRPHFITMERYGVNDFSHIPRDHTFYQNLDISEFKKLTIVDANTKYYRRAFAAIFYFALKDLLWFFYPHYEHHTPYSFMTEAFFVLRNGFRKLVYKFTERGLLEKLTKQEYKNYYFVPLQTYNDFQIIEHSNFSSIEVFIETVLHNFAQFSPSHTLLVIKHHPVDRGKRNYRDLINKISQKLQIEKRVITVHDLHLPSCLKSAIGTITINSTVGISSLYHNTPTIALGNAIYDIEGLTCKDMSLNNFWKEHKKPDKELFTKFSQYLIDKTQLNGSFYGRFPSEL
jgi:capsular polysaccharide export protein